MENKAEYSVALPQKTKYGDDVEINSIILIKNPKLKIDFTED